MEYHKNRFVDNSLVVKENGKIVMLFPANLSSENDLISHSGLTYGGIIVEKGTKVGSMKGSLKKLLGFCHNNRHNYIYFKKIPSFYAVH